VRWIDPEISALDRQLESLLSGVTETAKHESPKGRKPEKQKKDLWGAHSSKFRPKSLEQLWPFIRSWARDFWNQSMMPQ
jgi:hypothetical protein